MTIKIVADSACDMRSSGTAEFISVPLVVHTDDKQYVDDANLDIAAMTTELREHKGRSYSSCPSPAAWETAFSGNDDVIAFTITSGLSGSYNSAITAKNACDEAGSGRNIHIFDTLSAGPGIAILIDKARELIADGLDFDAVCEQIKDYMAHTKLLFALESLHNLAENGRVSHIVSLACGILGIRLIGKASDDGLLESLDKCRGAKNTVRGLLENMEKIGYHGGRVSIGHCLNESAAANVKEAIKHKFAQAEIKIYALGGLCSYYAENGGIMMGFEI